jgi:hypothetical protein
MKIFLTCNLCKIEKECDEIAELHLNRNLMRDYLDAEVICRKCLEEQK